MTELARLLDSWQADLESWAIPGHITAAVTESPWQLPRQVFARRADRQSSQPSGPSFARSLAALDPPGSVLDVGAGAGAACLPLLARTTELTAVDSDAGMLGLLADRAAAAGASARCVPGSWPEIAPQVPAADLVTCYNVLYNVPVLAPFLAALSAHARRLVVAEVTAVHPLAGLNPLWLRFHGLRRPERPTADDLLGILRAMGLRPGHQRWQRRTGVDYASSEELTEVTRRRLCLPPERSGEVAAALAGASADSDPGDREVVTIWWQGGAA